MSLSTPSTRHVVVVAVVAVVVVVVVVSVVVVVVELAMTSERGNQQQIT